MYSEHSCIRIIKVLCHVLVTMKDVWQTSVLFTGNTKLLFSTPCISTTTWPICTKFTYFMPSIYITLHTKCDQASENQPNCHTKFDHVFQVCCIITFISYTIKVKFTPLLYNFIGNLLKVYYKNTQCKSRPRDIHYFVIRYVYSLCQFGWFSLAQPQILRKSV